MFKRMTADEAVKLVKDGDRVCFNGQVRIAVPERFYKALADSFGATGHPKGIKYMATSSYDKFNDMVEHQHAGMIEEIVVAHYIAIAPFAPAIMANEISAYALPQGILAQMYDCAAARQPGFYSKVGLGTCVDPRVGSCGMNERSSKAFAEPAVVDGEEYLFYRSIYPDVCVLRGTTCDPNGNITMEKEASIMDPLAPAIATHNNGGIVIVQVERFSDEYADPHAVRIPGFLVDVVYEEPGQVMMDRYDYNPVFAGKERIPEEDIPALVDELLLENSKSRKPADLVIAKRAAMEVQPDFRIMNLGVGIPMLLGYEAYKMGNLSKDTAITLECGVGGGMPVGYNFGIVANPDVFMEQSAMFRLYEGGGLDMTAVGALEIDRHGNVNCIKKGKKLIGLGGFNHVTDGAKNVMVCSRFMVGSDIMMENGKLSVKDGSISKFCENVEFMNLNASVMRSYNKRILYVTERCVFRLAEGGLELIEIAPGLDLEKDILAHLPFRPLISADLKEMPWECFDV